LVVHVVLCFVSRFGFPLGLVGNLRTGHSGIRVDNSHIRLTTVDVGFGSRHPIARKIGFAIRSTHNSPSRCGGRTATPPSWCAATLCGWHLSACARGCGRLASQALSKHQEHSESRQDRESLICESH